jgi:transposase-like protein
VTQKQRAALKKWTARLARSDRADDARCANCNACAPDGPCETGYSAAGVLERRWKCTACGNQWSTSAGA